MTTPKPWPYPGARWWKFDFHTHTPASSDTRWAKEGVQLEPREWLLRFMQAEVDCVAVTDHNTGGWIARLQETYAALKVAPPLGFRELHIFPGVELSVHGGFHLLALFDVDATGDDITKLLGAVGYEGDAGDTNGVTRKSASTVVQEIVRAGALPVPAHADQAPRGVLRALDALTLRAFCQSEGIVAMEIVDPAVPRPQVYVDAKCGWTEILGSDWHGYEDGSAPGSRCTWVKMARPSLEGLRLALLDGQTFSIRRSDAPEPFQATAVPPHVVESIAIANARYMGKGTKLATFDLSPWLNALVGGRGTGKSTVVHALRLVYHRQGELDVFPETSEPRATFERFVTEPQNRQDPRGALDYKSSRGTEIVATVRRQGVRYRLRWRQDGQGSAVEELDGGEWKASPSQTITSERFPIRIFSQGQIAALTGESQAALLDVVDAGAHGRVYKQRIDEQKERFFALRAQLRAVDGKLRAREEWTVRLDDVRRKLDGFEGKAHAQVLKGYQLRLRQRRELDRQLETAGELARAIGGLAQRVAPEDIPDGVFGGEDDADRAATSLLQDLHGHVRKAAEQLATSARSLEQAAASSRAALEVSRWAQTFSDCHKEYEDLVTELRARGVGDPSEYGKLVQEHQGIEGELQRLAALERERDELHAEVERQLAQVRAARVELTSVRRAFLARTVAQNLYVRIEVQAYGRDVRSLERSLRHELGVNDGRFAKDILELENDAPATGVVAGLVEGLPGAEDEAEREFERRLEALMQRFERAVHGVSEFGGHLNNFLQAEWARRPELLDRLLVWSPEDALRVAYSPKGNGEDFRSIEQASAGQRAAAMLAFLLAHGDEPIVLDQPEDDLDNHLIYDLVVKQMRENKQRRQLIVVTHNPNIVVNGDAEMVHALDFRAGQCQPLAEKSGSLQEDKVREEVCRVMEGGREAFRSRYRRLTGVV